MGHWWYKLSSRILTARASQIQCLHQGIATLSMPSNTKSCINNDPILLELDVHNVVGCIFYNGSNPSPCLTIKWSSGPNTMVTITSDSGEKAKILTEQSVGICYNGQNVPQGNATIVSTQLVASTK